MLSAAASAADFNIAFENVMAPDVSLSLKFTGDTNAASPMIAAWAASRKFTVKPMVAGGPSGGTLLASVNESEAINPSSASVTTFAWPATIVAEVFPVDRTAPLPSVPAKSVSKNSSLPIGASTLSVHVRPPPATGLQFNAVELTFTIVAFAPLIEIETDWVFDEIYSGWREVAAGLTAAGILMAITIRELDADVEPAAPPCGRPEPASPLPQADKLQYATTLMASGRKSAFFIIAKHTDLGARQDVSEMASCGVFSQASFRNDSGIK